MMLVSHNIYVTTIFLKTAFDIPFVIFAILEYIIFKIADISTDKIWLICGKDCKISFAFLFLFLPLLFVAVKSYLLCNP